MAKLWQKSGKKLNSTIEAYTVGEDYILDQTLLPYDIEGTKAHLKALNKLKIITKAELNKLTSQLNRLAKDHKKGKVIIKIQDEDCHTVIENFLTKKYPKLGKKVHTGRSRNDQVLTALRLYMLDQLEALHKATTKLAKTFLKQAEKYQQIPLPGYSHTQQAMLTSVGHYFLNFTEALIDDSELLKAIKDHLSKNPLGSAAGFGTTLLLDRELTKKELKFKKVQINSLYCQNSRGKFESLYLEGLTQIMLTLSRFASDILLFTSQEFAYFKVNPTLTTGSSIMPQKQNLDGLEILRAKANVVTADQKLIQDITKSLISGYHRDLQLIKKPLFQSTEITLQSLEVAELYLKGLTPNEAQIATKITKEIYTADLATEMAQKKGIPFRTAYQKALKEIAKMAPDPKATLSSRISLGAPGNLDIHYYRNKLK